MKINWKDYFSRSQINKGERIFFFDDVEDISLSDSNTYSATVYDEERMYFPEVTKDSALQTLFFNCTCSEGENENPCIHTAALCKKIEAEDGHFFNVSSNNEKEEEDYPFDPFSSYSDEGYYFSIPKIFGRKFSINPETWEEAKRIVKNGRVNLNVSFRKGNYQNYIESSITMLDDRRYINASIKFNENAIEYLRCYGYRYECRHSLRSSQDYFIGSQLCIHQVVLLYATCEYIIKNNPGDTTNDNANNLLEALKNTGIFKPTLTDGIKYEKDDDSPVDLIASYDTNDDGLVFKIGRDKYYKIKSVKELKDNFLHQDKVNYGKNLTVNFKTATFTPRFEAIMDYIVRASDDSFGYSSYKHTLGIKDDDAERFYNLCKSTEIYIDENKRLTTAERDLRVNYFFSIKKKNNKEQEITVKIKFPYLLKAPTGYFGAEKSTNTFYKYNTTSLGILSSFIPSFHPYTKEFVFGESKIASFYNSVLPILQRAGDVDTSLLSGYEEWKENIPSFSFYFDYENELALCRASITSNGEVRNLRNTIPLDKNVDTTKESNVIEQIKAFFPLYNPIKEEWSTTPSDSDAVYLFLRDGISVFQELGEVNVSQSLKNINIKKNFDMNISVSLDNNLLNLSIENKDIPIKELYNVLDAYRKKKKYYRLKNGEFIELNDSLKEANNLLNGLNLSKKEYDETIKLPKYRALYLDKLTEERNNISIDKNQEYRKLIKDFNSFKESSYDVPSSLSSIMRPYQKNGFRWISTLHEYGFGGILADEMGLGKTLQLISFVLALKEQGIKGTTLVVCPASLVYNWEAEVKKFAPSLRVEVAAQSPALRKAIITSLSTVDILVTSYSLLKKDIDLYLQQKFLMCILDEAQFIKNSNTGVAKSVKLINASFRIVLTGTPIENRLSELWSIFDFLMPGFLFSKEQFSVLFENPIMKKNDKEATEKLKKMTGPFILRRRKSDVLKDLPEKIEEVNYSEMEEEQRKIYDSEVLRIRQNIESKDEEKLRQDKLQILSELTRIREICCDPSLLYENYQGGSAKLNALLDLVDRAIDEGHRILIFSQFTSMLSIIENALIDKYKFFEITGKTPKEERLKKVNEFNNGDVPIFLISLKAGGTGLNLTGADIVIHYDPWWNVAAQNQATDRAHRIGQTHVVTVYKMIAKNTIEERILELQESKKDLAEEILSGSEISLSSLSREDLLEILS